MNRYLLGLLSISFGLQAMEPITKNITQKKDTLFVCLFFLCTYAVMLLLRGYFNVNMRYVFSIICKCQTD